MTIKHLLYMQLCAFMYTTGACVVFFRFWNSPMKILYDIEIVASILDQRKYITTKSHECEDVLENINLQVLKKNYLMQNKF